jgi:Flp pilus assembly protein TadD
MKWLVIVASVTLLAACTIPDHNRSLSSKGNMRLVDAAMANGMPQTALSVTREILQGDPRNLEALLRQGDALVAMGQPAAAEECYRRAAEVDPQSADALRGLGRIRLALGQPKDAEAAFRRTLERTPNDAAAYNDLGISLDLQDRHADAQAAYQAALTRQPSMTAAQVNMGLSLALAGATDRALEMLRPLANDPVADGKVRQDLAVALTLAGDSAEAGKILSSEMSQDKVPTALAGYAALKASDK